MQKKKIICCVTNDLSFDQRMNRICTSLSSFGYEVLLCGRVLPNSISLQTKPYEQHRLHCFFTKGKLFYIEFNIRLFFFLLTQNADAINAIDLDTAPAALLFSKLKNKKLVYDAHELFTEVPEVIERPFTQKIWKIIEHLFIPATDLAYTVSESIANYFRQKYSVDFFVIKNVPVLKDISLSAAKERAIIYQGALNKGRGLEFLIDAMSEIDAILWIAGDGDLTQQLKQITREKKLKNKVQFLGKLNAETLAQKTAQATAGFNILEKRGLSYYYSLSNKTFDYIHAEIPQVISAFPEMQRLNEQYHFALEVKEISKKEISTAFNRLFEDESLCAEISKNCARAKQILNWQNEEQALKKMYEQLFG